MTVKESDYLSSFCGLECKSCPIHLATFEKDPAKKIRMRKEIAEICTRLYGMKFHPDDISDCDGCKADTGRLFSECNNCRIRKCASGKDLLNCAYCNIYPCDELRKLFSLESDARKKLEEIRAGL